MHMLVRKGVLALVLALALVSVTACDTTDTTGPDSTEQPGSTPADQTSVPNTEVSGMPVGFPADVPVHPGTVTSYEPTQVTDTAMVHQLMVESQAPFDEVTKWYRTSLPAGWTGWAAGSWSGPS